MSSESTPRHDEQYCATCGSVIKEQAALCPDCGSENDGTSSGPSDFHYCQSCGEQIHTNPELCPSCGVRQHSSNSAGLDGAGIILWVFGGLLMLWSLSLFVSPGGEFLFNILYGLFVFAIGLFALPPVHQRLGEFERRHSPTTFGKVKSVEKYPVERHDGRCASCNGPVEEGTRHEYAEEFALFGVVISVQESGSNVYCESCALIEDQGTSQYVNETPADQLSQTGTRDTTADHSHSQTTTTDETATDNTYLENTEE